MSVIDVTMPQLGESVSEGTVTRWLVREGETVKKDQALVEMLRKYIRVQGGDVQKALGS